MPAHLRTLIAVAVACALTLAAFAPSASAEGGAAVSWGENTRSQLGAGYKDDYELSPVPVLGPGGITEVRAGYNFTAGMLSTGGVEAWGGDVFGQLGDGSTGTTWEKQLTAVGVHGLQGEVAAISASGAHALALLRDGTVMAWGVNQDGELGDGEAGVAKELLVSGREPRFVPGLSNVVAIASGGGSNFALLGSGRLIVWGRNNAGQLGIGVGPERCKTEVGVEPCSKVPREAQLGLADGVSIKAISAGGEAAYALLSDGHVLPWGNNRWGQLGTDSEDTPAHPPAEVASPSGGGALSDVRAISGGTWHALALLESGQVVGWGANGRGDLGRASGEECHGLACDNEPHAIAGVPNASAIAAGAGFSLAVSGGRVYSFGADDFGQLGNGTRTAGSVPTAVAGLSGVTSVAAGNMHAVALLGPGATAPPALVRATPAPGSIALRWTVAATATGVRWRVAGGGPFGHVVKLGGSCSAATPCEYTIKGLSAQPYEVAFLTRVSEGVRSRRFLITPQP